MKILRTCALALLVTPCFSVPAMANDSVWFGVKAGTLGLGAEASWRPIEWLDVRAGVNAYDYDDTATYDGIAYDGTLALDSYYVTGNFRFPLSPFRLTAGAYTNNNEIRMSSQDMGSYLLGDNALPYTAEQVGTIKGVASFDSFAPYAGAGFDFDVLNRVGISLDFGVLWQGAPTVVLAADGLLADDPGLLADLDAEMQQVQDEMKNLQAYPVISIGFNFNFF